MMELNRVRPRRGCPEGSAVVTGAGQLPARWLIHAVGPIWRGGGFQEDEILGSAYETSLKLAAEKGAAVISFPSISTGAFGYPLEKAAPVALQTVARFLRQHQEKISEVIFVLYDRTTLQAYEKALKALEASGSA